MNEHQKSGGDAALSELLAAAGSTLTVAEVKSLAEGVAAAAPAPDPAEWIQLVCEAPEPALTAHLLALADAAGADFGLGVSPAPPERLDALRADLAARGLDGFVVPLADAHQGEFVAPAAQRLAWLTGFTGSAGLAIVTAADAAIFVDGRYTLQVETQVDTARFRPHHVTEHPPGEWIAAHLARGGRLGFDPWLHTADGVARLEQGCARAGAALEPVADNPVDAVWTNKPPPPISPAVPQESRFAGVESAAKRQQIAGQLKSQGADAAVLSAPDSIAWLLNMRGRDIANTPVTLCFAIIDANGGVSLFIDARKLTPALRRGLGNGVRIAPPDGLGAALDMLGAEKRRVRVDAATAPHWIFRRLTAAGAAIARGPDPCQLPKSCKNATELAGMRAAHVRDGAALTRFLAWLAAEAPRGTLTEMSSAAKLYEFRRTGEHFQGPSFETISGAGPNGAIVHYRVEDASNRPLNPGDVYLVDSGGQYLDGTTDVTRTVLIAGGKPPRNARDRFTRVLRGHIALAMARFPAGTSGGQLDLLARQPLWQAAADFDHGTGHGVGAYLGVHEGPPRIAKRGGDVPLQAGMVLSNEPGYYRTGAFGIRIENLIAVVPANKPRGAERDMLEFETLTLAPIDRNLIDPALMTKDEIAWLDAYHARVRDTLTPLVDGDTAAWLRDATAGLG